MLSRYSKTYLQLKKSNKLIKYLLIGLFATLSSTVLANDKNSFFIKKINQQVYLVSPTSGDSYTNFGVVVGDDGILLINAGMNYNIKAYEAAIKSISNLPVKYVINSNWDTYNVQGNKYWADKGAMIISHENLKYSSGHHQLFFKDKISLSIGSEQLTAIHSPAHSFGHINIYLAQANVVFMADSYSSHWLSPHGVKGLAGFEKGIDIALAMGNDDTLFVPGNTGSLQVSTKQQLLKHKALNSQFSRRVGELHNQGFDVDGMIKDRQLKDIAKQFEKYPSYHPYLSDSVIRAIETNVRQDYPLSQQELSAYVGTYPLNETSAIEVTLQNGALFAREEGKFLFELTPLSKEKFDFKEETRTDHLMFQLSASGKVLGLTPVLEKNSWWRNFMQPVKRLKSSVHRVQ